MLWPSLRAAAPPSPSPSPLLPLFLSPTLHSLPPLPSPILRLSPSLRLSRPSPLLAAPPRRRGREDEEEEYDQSEDEGDDDDDDAEAAMPFAEMRRWLERKPRGFGEGRMYDTAVEDRLLEEMERSRAAQLANVSNLRSQPARREKKQDDPPGKSVDAIQSGIGIRVSNLPRKKNIHRDLQSAFKGFPGLINISPAVIANKKTRDPICKGFAFLYFESEAAAERFVQMYSKKNVEFGKVEKQIFCDIINPRSSSNSSMQLADTRTNTSLKHTDTEKDSSRSNMDILTQDQDPLEGSSYDGSFGTEESPFLVEEDDPFSDLEAIETGIEHIDSPSLDSVQYVSETEVDVSDSNDSMPLSQNRKKQVASKKQNRSGKQKPVKNPKLGLPGSVSRLKIKERTILSGVFSKYGSKEVVVSSKEG
ncbi:hypothetical protein ACMD2_19703 [Ananas comosus]|uniref:RRM domain-containing protein n=1 Tax=Ananas comosus TaxID=4615 RepID=A0A199W4A8_ANACO|nr:hypothetical protein ACMD2_19703 [Ananas comosus]